MKYLYRNIKHVTLHGIAPGEIKEFNHKIEGGGIELIKEDKIGKPIKSRKVRIDKIEKEIMESDE